MKLSHKGRTLVLWLFVVTICVVTAIAQETTAGMQGTVKDPAGAVVSKATVEVSSPSLIGIKKLETDNGGYYRFANLPPGTYTLTVTAQGFSTQKQTGILLEVGKLPTIDISMKVGGTEQTVEVSSAAPLVDVATSKVQTNITADVLENVPKGRSFQSVIQFAPGSRNEPLQNGYQIDGASNSENAYMVEGQETASVFDGHSAANVPIEFIQEVQVKTSGFEAEYGGALGGVVNVIQKRGSNAWHGSVFNYFQGDALDSAPNRILRKDPNTSVVGQFDQASQYYQPKKDHYRIDTPGFELGGYIVKDRLWIFGSAAPQYNNTTRTIDFAYNPAGGQAVNGPVTFHNNVNTYYSLARIDYLLTQKIRVYGSYQYNYERGMGASPTSLLPAADDAYGLSNPVAGNNPFNYNGGIGYVQPNSITGFGADITLTPALIATTRYGYFFENYGDRGLPQGLRYFYRNSNYSYNTGNVPADLVTGSCSTPGCGNVALDGTTLDTVNGGQFVQPTGYSNIGVNASTQFDAFKRYSFNQDLAYFKKGFGTHNLKFGYAFNRGTNDVLNGYNTADVYVAYNTLYSPITSGGLANCTAISGQNATWFGTTGTSGNNRCQGDWGTVNVRDLGTTGKVGGMNHALYLQDAWTVGKRLTLNLGVRADKESLPSYSTLAGFKGINFGFGDKVAPRLGASYDMFGNGKLKLYGSYGYFFDIMKFQLPRGSFGGDYWHDCVYALDQPDYTIYKPTRDAAGHYCPTSGPANLNTSAGLRFIENFDFRHPSNDPTQPGSLGATGLIDPNLKPMKQHEYVVGADWALTPSLAFETRYSRKRLDRTIEDAGIITNEGEVYYITNPGEGVNTKVAANICPSCPVNPGPNRRYDGVEFRLTKRSTGRWFGQLSYTYSRLYGNYSGLTATDISDGGAARNSPNVDRSFDEPYMSFDAHGRAIDGPLPTDRPNAFKAIGYYRLKWWKFETLLGGYQQWYSGTPLTSYISVWGAPVFTEGRGNWVDVTTDASGNWTTGAVRARRTPQYSQTDFSLVQEMHVSKTNEKLMLGFEANISNLFNQHSATVIDSNLLRSSFIGPASCGTAGTSCTADATDIVGFDYAALMTKGYNYAAQANDDGVILSSIYGHPTSWQNPRNMRFKVRFSF